MPMGELRAPLQLCRTWFAAICIVIPAYISMLKRGAKTEGTVCAPMRLGVEHIGFPGSKSRA